MAEKRIVIAVSVLVIIGIFFFVSSVPSPTGAFIGVSREIDSGSNFIIGLFFFFLAGLMVVGASKKERKEQENVNKAVNAREKFDEFLEDSIEEYQLDSMKNLLDIRKKKGKKLRDYTDKDYQEVADYLIKGGVKYTNKKLFGLPGPDEIKSKEGVEHLKDSYIRNLANLKDEDIQNMASGTVGGLAKVIEKSSPNIAGKIVQYHTLGTPEDERKYLGKGLAKELGTDPELSSTPSGLIRLWDVKKRKKGYENSIEQAISEYKKAA